MNKPHEQANAWHPVIFSGVCGASTATTLHILFSTEPNMVNLSAAGLSALVAIISGYEAGKAANKQNDMFDTLYRRNKQR